MKRIKLGNTSFITSSRLDSAEHPYGNRMKTYTMGYLNENGGVKFSVTLGHDYSLCPLSAARQDHDFTLAGFPMGVVHPSRVPNGPLGPLHGFGGDFFGGPDNVGPPCTHAAKNQRDIH